ncbi:efflux RND transporter periplasmic adaptor subunit [Novosphingobium sp. ERN07]|uniref:efflux RND transporter periplasmic adaptor subunit n=1 Tax=Novosphingobium sp. ERN07 TaxID=2726187 RepID=UPI0014566C70|nr:efflux RND transporter periplasmic adaptor subunit [Novosphingobium sp. ERN07]NLR72182.1 efflux RND transporter periplasmic adaptor subunit [Novosphingobium sp. ERN07]
MKMPFSLGPFTLNRRTWMLVAVLVPLLLLFAWVAFRFGPLAPVRVTAVTVEERAIAPALFGIGTVEARYTQRIGPTAPGRVASLAVDVGNRVVAGQLIAVIDPIDLDQRIAAASGSAGRSAALEQAATSQIADAGARLALARNEADRGEALFRGGWLTRAALDQRRQALAAAQAGLATAQANRSAAALDRGRTGAERAALVEQKANLRLVAPRAGLVVRRLSEPGTTVVAGQAVIEVVDPAELWINARFDQTRAAGLVAGLPARIVLRSQADRGLGGKILRVEPVADPVTEEVLAKVSFDKAIGEPPIGELAEVTIALPARSKALAVPNAAIYRVGGKLGVWAIREGDLEFVPVRLGVEDADGWVQVLDGLTKGDRIVLHSARPLSTGSNISIVDKLP